MGTQALEIDHAAIDAAFERTQLGLEAMGWAANKVLGITGVSFEVADEGRGWKGVFIGEREGKSPNATFEAGSFLDNGGLEGEITKHDICISTAGGCTRSCAFCAVPTADIGFERLLEAPEIVFQYELLKALRNPGDPLPNYATLMGNGEPPDNKATLPAVAYFAQQPDVGAINVSTIGENLRGIDQLAEVAVDNRDTGVPVKLQLSLHAADEEKRRSIIPGRKSIEQIMPVVDDYAESTGVPVKFNVVLMNGVDGTDAEGFTNASIEDAIALAALLNSPSRASGKPIRRRLKLSAFNPIPGIPFVTPSEAQRREFTRTLGANGITEIKTFKGSGIDIADGLGGMACGQLRATTSQIQIIQ